MLGPIFDYTPLHEGGVALADAFTVTAGPRSIRQEENRSARRRSAAKRRSECCAGGLVIRRVAACEHPRFGAVQVPALRDGAQTVLIHCAVLRHRPSPSSSPRAHNVAPDVHWVGLVYANVIRHQQSRMPPRLPRLSI